MNDFTYLFERCLVETVEEISDEMGMSHVELARKAFPGAADAGRKWRQVRGTKKKKPQRLTIDDAASLARVIGRDLPELCFTVSERLKNGWQYNP